MIQHLHGSWRPRPFDGIPVHVRLERLVKRRDVGAGKQIAFGVNVP